MLCYALAMPLLCLAFHGCMDLLSRRCINGVYELVNARTSARPASPGETRDDHKWLPVIYGRRSWLTSLNPMAGQGDFPLNHARTAATAVARAALTLPHAPTKARVNTAHKSITCHCQCKIHLEYDQIRTESSVLTLNSTLCNKGSKIAYKGQTFKIKRVMW